MVVGRTEFHFLTAVHWGPPGSVGPASRAGRDSDLWLPALPASLMSGRSSLLLKAYATALGSMKKTGWPPEFKVCKLSYIGKALSSGSGGTVTGARD